MRKDKRHERTSSRELAKAYGVTARTIQRWKSSGQLAEIQTKEAIKREICDLNELREAIKTSFLLFIEKYTKAFEEEGLELGSLSEKDKIYAGLQLMKILGELSK